MKTLTSDIAVLPSSACEWMVKINNRCKTFLPFKNEPAFLTFESFNCKGIEYSGIWATNKHYLRSKEAKGLA